MVQARFFLGSILLLGLSLSNSIVRGAPVLPDRGDLSILEENASLEKHALNQRETLDWFTQKWPGVWAGSISCPAVADPTEFANQIAVDAYNSMVNGDKGKPNNLVAAFCIPGKKCFVGTIPDRDETGDAQKFVLGMMALVPVWEEAYGKPKEGHGKQLHAEDLALALAAEVGEKFPYTVNLKGEQVKARVVVHGLYYVKAKKVHDQWVDNFGAAGLRWPCRKQHDLKRPSVCFNVLKKLSIRYDYLSDDGKRTLTTN